MNQNNELLAAFVKNAVIRNRTTKNITEFQKNFSGTYDNIVGTIIDANGLEVASSWRTDGFNRIHGFDYDLIQPTTYADFIAEFSPEELAAMAAKAEKGK